MAPDAAPRVPLSIAHGRLTLHTRCAFGGVYNTLDARLARALSQSIRMMCNYASVHNYTRKTFVGDDDDDDVVYSYDASRERCVYRSIAQRISGPEHRSPRRIDPRAMERQPHRSHHIYIKCIWKSVIWSVFGSHWRH